MTTRPLLATLLALAGLGACKPAATTPPPTPAANPVDVILAGSDLPATLDAPLPGDGMAVTIHRLKNGLTVYISTDRQKPRVSAWIAVRTGSRNDPAASTGLAHYLEHMLFKGTDELGTLDWAAEKPHLDKVQGLYKELRQNPDATRRAAIFADLDKENLEINKFAVPNEMDRLYTSLGIEGINAFTSDDMTVYISDLPQNRLEAWAAVETERFKDPSYRLFYTELESVYEEKNLSIDSPDGQVYERTLAQLYPRHPYGTQTTIGSIDHLKNPAYQDMLDYKERWYVPNNMAVLLSGDIDAQTALPLLERTLGTWEPKPLTPPEPGQLTKIGQRVFSEVVAEGEQAVTIGWTTVPFNDPDEPVVTVLSWLLDNDTSGLLNLELELSQKVPDASASTSNSHESGYLTVKATAREGQPLEEVEKLLLDTVEKLKSGAITQQDIDAIVLANDIRRKMQYESTDGRVYKLMESFVYRQPWQKMLERDDRLRKVTREDVIRVANAHLGQGMSVVYRRNGKPPVAKIDKPKISPLTIDTTRKSKFAAQIEAMKAPELTPEWLVEGTHYARAALPGGELIAVVNKRNDLFHVHFSFDRGSKKDPLLCHAFDLLEQSGAADKSAEDLKKQLFALGSSISFGCDPDDSSISVRGVDANMPATLVLLESWLREPKADQATLDKLTANTISQRHDSVEDPEALWDAVAQYAARDKQSEHLQAPSNAQLQKAKVAQLTTLMRGVLDHTHKTLYFGPRPLADVKPLLSLGKSHRKLTRRAPTTYRKAKESTVYFVHREVAKSYVWVAIPHAVLPRDHKPKARLFNTYLGGGMNALLFQEMREARGLVYFSFGFVNSGRYPDDVWAMAGGMGTQVDKTPEALSTYLDLVRGKSLDETRITTARATLDQEFRSSRIDPRESIWWIDSWDDAGEKTDPRPWYWEQIGAMSPDQLKTFANTFAELPVLVGVVGDRARVDMAALAKVGKVVELKPEQLFSYGPFPKPKAAAAAAPAAASAPAPAAAAAPAK